MKFVHRTLYPQGKKTRCSGGRQSLSGCCGRPYFFPYQGSVFDSSIFERAAYLLQNVNYPGSQYMFVSSNLTGCPF